MSREEINRMILPKQRPIEEYYWWTKRPYDRHGPPIPQANEAKQLFLEHQQQDKPQD